jgi:hypothetical protein
MYREERAQVQHQRPFRITNRLIVIRRQVIWSSIMLEDSYRSS